MVYTVQHHFWGISFFFGGGGFFCMKAITFEICLFHFNFIGKKPPIVAEHRSCVKTASVSAIFTLYFRTPLHSTAPDIQHTISYHMAPHMISYMLVSLSNRYNIEEFMKKLFRYYKNDKHS